MPEWSVTLGGLDGHVDQRVVAVRVEIDPGHVAQVRAEFQIEILGPPPPPLD